MVEEEHLAILRQGVEAWNEWRQKHAAIEPDLRGADLFGAHLREANLSEAHLRRADLGGVDLSRAHLSEADLSRADLFRADLSRADLSAADLRRANLSEIHLYETILANLDLSSCKGLDSCRHAGPSTIDHRTLQRSGPLPLAFLRGVGLPENLIDYLPSLLKQAIQMYSCFISHSSRDEEFAQRLHADLQNKGVRCWFAPYDLPIGAKILDTLDEAIRLRDKLLLVLSEHAIASDWVEDEVTALVLSEHAIASDWVEDEVTAAFEEERTRKRTVLFPIRLDDVVMETNEAWAAKLRARNIGDFRRWKEHDAYHKALERLLRDLRVKAG